LNGADDERREREVGLVAALFPVLGLLALLGIESRR